jgi:hypothetical protein
VNRKVLLQASWVVFWLGGAITLLLADDREPDSAPRGDAGNPIVGECERFKLGKNGWWSPGLRDRMRRAGREYNDQLDSTLNGGGD